MIASKQIAFGKAAGAKKPYDAEIEYLESTGTQYIDTGVLIDTSTATVEIAFMPHAGIPGYQAYYGVDETGKGQFSLRKSTNVNDILVLKRATVSIGLTADGKWHNVKVTPNKAIVDGIDIALTQADAQYTKSLMLFARITTVDTITAYAKCRIASFQIYCNGALVRDLIPVRVGNVGYMYDRVSGQLFGNQGTGEFVLGPDIIDYTAKDYVQDGLIRMLDSIETTGFGEKNYDDGTVVKNLATGADSGVVIGTNVIKNETTIGVVANLPNIVFKEAIADVSSAFSNNSFTLEFYGLIPDKTVGVFDNSANNYSYRLLSLKYSPNTVRFYCGDSFADVAVDMTALHTFSLARNGSECIAYVDGNAVATFQALVSAVPNLLGFYLYENQVFGSYRFFSRALNDTEIFSNASIDKARFGL